MLGRKRGGTEAAWRRWLRSTDEGIGLVLLIAFASVGTAAVAGSVYSASRIEYQLSSHSEFHVNALHSIQRVDSHVGGASHEALAYLLSGDERDKVAFEERARAFRDEAVRFRRIARFDRAGEGHERLLFDRIEGASGELIAGWESLMEASDASQPVTREALARYEVLVHGLRQDLAALVEVERAEVESQYAAVLAILRSSERLFIAVGLVIFVLALGFGRSVGRAVARRTVRVRQAERERHLLERQVRAGQKLESLGLLAGGIAHDFNNLLVGILGNAESLKAGIEFDSPSREALDDIQEAGELGAKLTQELMAFAGKSKTKFEPLDLSTLVGHTLRLLGKRLPVTARFETALEDGLWVTGDATQLRQVILNLLVNAADALDGQEGVIQLRAGVTRAEPAETPPERVVPVPHSGSYVFFEVADPGCGMDPETLERIFDPFFTTKVEGRGLGLASMLGIICAHDGSAEVSSEPGRGSVFRVLLPQCQPAQVPVEVRTDAAAERPPRGTVLVVDDHPAVARATARMVQATGLVALTACGGRDAIEQVTADPLRFDAVVLDLSMPGLDGRATFEQLRTIRPDLPVVFYSGGSGGESPGLVDGRTGTAFLPKPFSMDQLVEKLGEVGL